jgi:hypothetical protein
MNYQARTPEEWAYRIEGISLTEEELIYEVERSLDGFEPEQALVDALDDPDFCLICQGTKNWEWHCDPSHCTCYDCTETEAMRGEP